MKSKKYIILLFVLFITPIVISGQSEVRLNSRGRISPPGIPRGATHEGAFALALKDPNIFIGVFEFPPSNTKLPSGEYLWSLPDIREASNKFSPLLCVKSIKGKFVEPIIWYCRLPAPRGEGRPADINGMVYAPDGKWILAVQKTTSEYRIGRFGEEIKKYPYINDDEKLFNILWYGYGGLCLKWPEGREEPAGIVRVNDSMVDDLIAIAKEMPSIEKAAKDPNDTAVISKISLSLKNDLSKSILEKVTEEKEETPGAGQGGFITNRR